jgi:hypothetical protein
MILFKRHFWSLVYRLGIVLIAELGFSLLSLLIYLIIYETAEKEWLNTASAAVVFKILVSLPPCLYNIKGIRKAYSQRDFYLVGGFVAITVLYEIFIWSLGGGGR